MRALPVCNPGRSLVVRGGRVWRGRGRARILGRKQQSPGRWGVRDAATGRDRWLGVSAGAFVTAQPPKRSALRVIPRNETRPERPPPRASPRGFAPVDLSGDAPLRARARACDLVRHPIRPRICCGLLPRSTDTSTSTTSPTSSRSGGPMTTVSRSGLGGRGRLRAPAGSRLQTRAYAEIIWGAAGGWPRVSNNKVSPWLGCRTRSR
jgi:hypothetical protein